MQQTENKTLYLYDFLFTGRYLNVPQVHRSQRGHNLSISDGRNSEANPTAAPHVQRAKEQLKRNVRAIGGNNWWKRRTVPSEQTNPRPIDEPTKLKQNQQQQQKLALTGNCPRAKLWRDRWQIAEACSTKNFTQSVVDTWVPSLALQLSI